MCRHTRRRLLFPLLFSLYLLLFLPLPPPSLSILSLFSTAGVLPISTPTELDLSRHKEKLFSDYEYLSLIFALSLTRDIWQERRRGSR
jgi:hypothetical protein